MTMETEAWAQGGLGVARLSSSKVLLLMVLVGAIAWSLFALASPRDPQLVSSAFPDKRVALIRMQAVFPEISGGDDVWSSSGEAGGRQVYTILFAGGDQAKAVRAYDDATGPMTELQMRIRRDGPIDPVDQSYYIAPIVAAVSGAATGAERTAAVDVLAALARRGQSGAVDIGPAHISITASGGLVIRATPRSPGAA